MIASRSRRSIGGALAALCAIFAAAASGSAASTPVAAATSATAGTLTIIGSDTLSALELRWIDAFRARHPEAHVQLQAPGSASAPVALIEGAADIGAMSRPMSAGELERFRDRYGYLPLDFVVARDAIVVFVHPDNPLDAISRRQLDAVFSATLRCGAGHAATRWRDLGVPDADSLAGLRILATGRNRASGTNEFFRESALCGGRYRDDVVEWPGHGATVAAVADHRNAIGYAGIGYVNARVKALAFAPSDGEAAIAPTLENVMNGDYALARPLHFYLNRPPGRALAELPARFVEYVMSDEAQAVVEQEGLLPVARSERAAQAKSIRETMTP